MVIKLYLIFFLILGIQNQIFAKKNNFSLDSFDTIYLNYFSGDIGYEYFLNSRNSLLIEGSLGYIFSMNGVVHPKDRYALGFVPSILLEYRHYFFKKKRFFANVISGFGDNKRSFSNPKHFISIPDYPQIPLMVLGIGYQKGFWNRGYFRISGGSGLLYKGFERNIGMGFNLNVDLGIRF